MVATTSPAKRLVISFPTKSLAARRARTGLYPSIAVIRAVCSARELTWGASLHGLKAQPADLAEASNRRIGQHVHFMAPPDEFGGETNGWRDGPSSVDHRQQEPGTAMPQVFNHHWPALARSRCAALTISISSTMTISSLIGVAQQVGAERQRALVVAPHADHPRVRELQQACPFGDG